MKLHKKLENGGWRKTEMRIAKNVKKQIFTGELFSQREVRIVLFVYLWIVVLPAKIWIFLRKNASRVVSKHRKQRRQMWFSHSLQQILTKEKEKRFRVNWKVNLKGWKASGTVCVSDDNLILASTFQLWLPNIASHSVTLRKPTQKGKENTRRIQQKNVPHIWRLLSQTEGRSPFLKVVCGIPLVVAAAVVPM